MTGAAPQGSADVRRLLGLVLRSDSDLDAFCLDYFPAVYRRFSRGMSRVEKVNLLLEQEPDPVRVVERLREFCPDDAVWPARDRRPVAAWRTRWPIIPLGLGLALALGALFWQLSQRASDNAAQRPAVLRAVPYLPEPKAPAAVNSAVLAPLPPAAAPTADALPEPAAPRCGSGNSNASCNQIQAAPGSTIIINARQSR